MKLKKDQLVTQFQNRIIGYKTKPADQFQANPLNYRKHPQAQREAVNASLQALGWISPVIENITTGNLIDGHERVWQSLPDNADVPYLEVALSEEEERLALAIFDPITAMAETDADLLEQLLLSVNTDAAALQSLLSDLAVDAGIIPDPDKENPYTRTIESPVYTPTQAEPPPIPELFDHSRTVDLLQEIQAADGITEEERNFLAMAAQRHTVIHFRNVAEYYAHASAPMQRLMENSALVIIDLNRAIELGYVELTKKIAALAEEEYG